MSNTSIHCKNCKGTVGDYLGIVSIDGDKKHLHKCLKCKQQMTTGMKEGLNFA